MKDAPPARELFARCHRQIDVTRGSVNRWLQWYEADGVDGLRTKKAPGAAPRLSPDQEAELVEVVQNSPLAAGFSTGLWTGRDKKARHSQPLLLDHCST